MRRLMDCKQLQGCLLECLLTTVKTLYKIVLGSNDVVPDVLMGGRVGQQAQYLLWKGKEVASGMVGGFVMGGGRMEDLFNTSTLCWQ